MSHGDLVTTYVEEAEENYPNSVPAQIEFLIGKRKELREEVTDGDWEVGNTSFEGESTSARRGISATARLSAVRDAIKRLNGDVSAGRGRMLIAKFHRIPI